MLYPSELRERPNNIKGFALRSGDRDSIVPNFVPQREDFGPQEALPMRLPEH